MIVTAAALAIVVASIGIAVLVGLRTRDVRQAIAVMLDLWVAAGLLRLSQDADWQRIVGAAAMILVRKLVIFSFAHPPLHEKPA